MANCGGDVLFEGDEMVNGGVGMMVPVLVLRTGENSQPNVGVAVVRGVKAEIGKGVLGVRAWMGRCCSW